MRWRLKRCMKRAKRQTAAAKGSATAPLWWFICTYILTAFLVICWRISLRKYVFTMYVYIGVCVLVRRRKDAGQVKAILFINHTYTHAHTNSSTFSYDLPVKVCCCFDLLFTVTKSWTLIFYTVRALYGNCELKASSERNRKRSDCQKSFVINDCVNGRACQCVQGKGVKSAVVINFHIF